MYNSSDHAITSTIPRLDPCTIYNDDAGVTWGTIISPINNEVAVCSLQVTFNKNGYLNDSKQGHHAVIAQTYVHHVEYHRSGLLHRWSGPALIHGEEHEFWLYGVAFTRADHEYLTNTLVEGDCNSNLGQLFATSEQFDKYAFIDTCVERHQVDQVLATNLVKIECNNQVSSVDDVEQLLEQLADYNNQVEYYREYVATLNSTINELCKNNEKLIDVNNRLRRARSARAREE